MQLCKDSDLMYSDNADHYLRYILQFEGQTTERNKCIGIVLLIMLKPP